VDGPSLVQQYRMRVINRGSAAAPGAEVSLAVGGAAVDTVTVG
jgi:hypothetical protein